MTGGVAFLAYPVECQLQVILQQTFTMKKLNSVKIVEDFRAAVWKAS
jgi:hypothetical protein